ncbi:MAG: ComF family protein [Eubacterium sp.]|nr:ComF family protein [Eubacterium sp.]
MNKLIKAFYPDVCPRCDKVIGRVGLCEDCKDSFKYIKNPTCAICGRTMSEDGFCCEDCTKIEHFFKRNVSVFEYRGDIKECIYRFKYSNMRCYAEFFAEEAVKRYWKLLKMWKVDCIVPVPMYKNKQKKRGYNQAEEFAKSLSKITSIKMDAKYLKRRKDTVPMKTLSKQQRYENLKKAFVVNKDRSTYKRVLVVDDIFTTGSTIDACAKVLRKNGVEVVYSLCIASGS